MNEIVEAAPTTRSDDPPGPPRKGRPAGSAWGCLQIVGKLGLVLAGLALLAFVALYLSFQQTFKAPEAVPAPIAWTSREVALSPDQPVVRGVLTLTASAVSESDLRVGLNAGVPLTSAEASPSGPGATGPPGSPEPAAVLSGPLVRVTAVTASGAPQSCLAPCELQLPSGFVCLSGTCRLDFDVTIELITDSALVGRSVTVGVAGGATAPLARRLPEGLMVDLALQGAIVPGGS